jgi:transcriptional regulator with XRE-family HTH domain
MAGLTVGQLAKVASVSRSAIMRFERGQRASRLATEQALQSALEGNGVRFTERGVEPAD